MARMANRWRDWEGLAEAAHYHSRELARLCGLSSRQLQREFRRSLGRTPQDWLNERRIIAAQRLLLTGLSVKAVAIELSFKQTSHFCRQFKLLLGMTPTEYALRGDVEPAECRSEITSVAQR